MVRESGETVPTSHEPLWGPSLFSHLKVTNPDNFDMENSGV